MKPGGCTPPGRFFFNVQNDIKFPWKLGLIHWIYLNTFWTQKSTTYGFYARMIWIYVCMYRICRPVFMDKNNDQMVSVGLDMVWCCDFYKLFLLIKWLILGSMVKKMFIEVRLRNLTTYVFKGHVKVVKIFMLKSDVSILNSLKIMLFFCKYKVNTKT